MTYSKKAIVWTSIVEIVLALLVIGASAYFFVTVYEMMSASQQGQITMSNFNGLANAVQQLIDDPAKFKAERNFPFYIEPEYAVVGFNKGVGGAGSTRGVGSVGTTCLDGINTEPAEASIPFVTPSFEESTEGLTMIGNNELLIKKPLTFCGENACLCLYKRLNLVNPQQIPEKCTPFKDVDIFYSSLDPQLTFYSDAEIAAYREPSEEERCRYNSNFVGSTTQKQIKGMINGYSKLNHLVITGECKTSLVFGCNHQLGLINLYLDKITATMNSILITPQAFAPTTRLRGSN